MMNILQKFDIDQNTASFYTDNITGLYTHSIFQITVNHEIERSERYGKYFSLVLIDIDRFSLYNEKNNHSQGDVMLRQIAGVIEANIRKVDIAARYSGDQFFILITESDINGALKVAERIRDSVEQMTNLGLTISIGLAVYPIDSNTRIGLIEKAFEALQEAKIRGGNRVYYLNNDNLIRLNKKSISSMPKILIVDDIPLNLKMLEGMLNSEGYQIIKAEDGHNALHIVTKHEIDLILLDVMMPIIDGYEVCQRLKTNEKTRRIPVVMITALDDSTSKIKGIEAGADDFITKPPHKAELLARVKSLINVNNLNKNLADIKNVLLSLAIAVEAKDSYTQGHVERVANLAVSLGKKLGLAPKDIEALWFAGVLHDIGKIGIPDGVLNKIGKLNSAEWEIMKMHTDIGYKICLPLKNTLGTALEAIRHHHERLDGSGYPDGLKGDMISEIAQIMSIVDYYDALTTDRPYRKKLSKDETFTILRSEALSGKIDAEIMEKLIEMVSN